MTGVTATSLPRLTEDEMKEETKGKSECKSDNPSAYRPSIWHSFERHFMSHNSGFATDRDMVTVNQLLRQAFESGLRDAAGSFMYMETMQQLQLQLLQLHAASHVTSGLEFKTLDILLDRKRVLSELTTAAAAKEEAWAMYALGRKDYDCGMHDEGIKQIHRASMSSTHPVSCYLATQWFHDHPLPSLVASLDDDAVGLALMHTPGDGTVDEFDRNIFLMRVASHRVRNLELNTPLMLDSHGFDQRDSLAHFGITSVITQIRRTEEELLRLGSIRTWLL